MTDLLPTLNAQQLLLLVLGFGAMASLALVGVGVVLTLILLRRGRDGKVGEGDRVSSAPPLRDLRQASRTAIGSSPAQLEPVAALPPPKPKQIFYKTESGQDMVGIQLMNAQRFDQAKKTKVDIEQSHFARLSPLLQAAPTILQSTAAGSGKYMEVIVNGKLFMNAETGLLRPIVKAENGKIIEMAQLKNPSSLKAVSLGAGAFAVLSFVVGQAHLGDINRKLEAILDQINRISDFQQNDRAATIKSRIDYLRNQIYPSVVSGEISTAVRNQLESIDMDLAKIQDHLSIDLLTELRSIGVSRVTFKGTGTKEFELLVGKCNGAESIASQLLFCIEARSLAWQILMFFPGESQLKSHRRQAIVDSIKNVIETSDDRSIDQALSNVDGLSAWLSGKDTLSDFRSKMRSPLTNMREQMKIKAPPIAGHINVFNAKMLELERPMSFAVRMEQGEIVEAHRLN